MKTLMRVAVLAVMSTGLCGSAASAVEIFEREPCDKSDNPCTSIAPDTNFPRELSFISIASASSGRAQVSLHGTMLCSSESKTPAVVDLVTQIVTSQNTVPAINGPGGARHAHVILPTELGTSVSFNLAATRVLPVFPGQNIFSFNVASLRMDPATSCIFYNLGFSTVYVEDR